MVACGLRINCRGAVEEDACFESNCALKRTSVRHRAHVDPTADAGYSRDMHLRKLIWGWVFTSVFAAHAELVRVTPDRPGITYHYNSIDFDGDGLHELTLSGGVIIPLGGSLDWNHLQISLYQAPHVFLAGASEYPVTLGIGEVLGPSLHQELEWVPKRFGFDIANRSFSFSARAWSPWRGLLGDTLRPYIGLQFQLDDGLHFGWIRFGNYIGRDNVWFSGSYVIEWAYETEPGKPVTITAPQNSADSYLNASELPLQDFRFWSDNSTASNELGEFELLPAGAGASLWWKWTAPTNGLMWLASRSGPFETVMGVYQGSSLHELQSVVVTEEGCVNGLHGLQRELEFEAEQGVTYHIMLDSRKLTDGVTETGEIHLEGSFSTVELVAPHFGAMRHPEQPIYFSVTNSVHDGVLDYIEIEANGKIVAHGWRGELFAHWFDAKPGPYDVRALWYDSNGVVRRSPPRTVHVRPLNGEYQWAQFIDANQWSTRASNVYSSRQEGEPMAPSGTDANSVWWRWYAAESGVLALNVPDGNGLMSVAVYDGFGPWDPATTPVGENPPHPDLDGRLMNHVQLPVIGGHYYALCVRTVKNSAGSWHGTGGCKPVFISGREFLFQLDFTPSVAGRLLAIRSADEMLGTFAAPPGQRFTLESSTNLNSWHELEQGVTTGMMQLLQWTVKTNSPQEFFRLKVAE